MTTFNDDVTPEDFEGILGEEPFTLREQTADIPSSSSTYFNTQPEDTIYSPPFPSNLNADLNFTPKFGRPSDWTLPPSLSPFTDLESLSSSASAGVYHDPAWNPFDFTLSGVNRTINNGAFVSRNPYVSANSNGSSYQNEYAGRNDSRVSLSSINPPLDAPNFDYDVGRSGSGDLVPTQRTYQYQSFPTSPLPSPGFAPGPQARSRQPAWGQSRSRGGSSSTSSRSQNQKRRKSTDQNDQTSSSRLRSTSGSYKAGTTSSSGTFSTMNTKGENSKTRTNHNQIEKQYRNRLNSQFEVLLSILPKEEVVPATAGQEGDGEKVGIERVEERKISKAEVLEMAMKHIRTLEREGKDLNSENKTLKLRVEELNRIWVESGGVVMP